MDALEMLFEYTLLLGCLYWAGMEVASSLAGTAATVSVVDIIKVPFQLVLGEKVGSVLQKVTPRASCPFRNQCEVTN